MPSSGSVRGFSRPTLRTGIPVRPLTTLLLPWLLLSLPPVGSWLKLSMVGHMLVQMPLLVVCGFLLARRLRQTHAQLGRSLRPYRWSLLLCATFTLMVWMLPRLLDLAVESTSVDMLKVLSLSFLAGLPLGLAWPLFGPVVHGLIHVEALATLWRLGWLYLESPSRLCSRYALDDQSRLGMWMLALGGVYALWLVALALSGSVDSRTQE